MDRRELEYIIVIAQEKNLSKAAERLYVSQPALSRFLLKLETQAGLPLFERKRRQLVPTLAGELYLDTAGSFPDRADWGTILTGGILQWNSPLTWWLWGSC